MWNDRYWFRFATYLTPFNLHCKLLVGMFGSVGRNTLIGPIMRSKEKESFPVEICVCVCFPLHTFNSVFRFHSVGSINVRSIDR